MKPFSILESERWTRAPSMSMWKLISRCDVFDQVDISHWPKAYRDLSLASMSSSSKRAAGMDLRIWFVLVREISKKLASLATSRDRLATASVKCEMAFSLVVSQRSSPKRSRPGQVGTQVCCSGPRFLLRHCCSLTNFYDIVFYNNFSPNNIHK